MFQPTCCLSHLTTWSSRLELEAAQTRLYSLSRSLCRCCHPHLRDRAVLWEAIFQHLCTQEATEIQHCRLCTWWFLKQRRGLPPSPSPWRPCRALGGGIQHALRLGGSTTSPFGWGWEDKAENCKGPGRIGGTRQILANKRQDGVEIKGLSWQGRTKKPEVEEGKAPASAERTTCLTYYLTAIS